jgi:hypothetical protein
VGGLLLLVGGGVGADIETLCISLSVHLFISESQNLKTSDLGQGHQGQSQGQMLEIGYLHI